MHPHNNWVPPVRNHYPQVPPYHYPVPPVVPQMVPQVVPQMAPPVQLNRYGYASMTPQPPPEGPPRVPPIPPQIPMGGLAENMSRPERPPAFETSKIKSSRNRSRSPKNRSRSRDRSRDRDRDRSPERKSRSNYEKIPESYQNNLSKYTQDLFFYANNEKIIKLIQRHKKWSKADIKSNPFYADGSLDSSITSNPIGPGGRSFEYSDIPNDMKEARQFCDVIIQIDKQKSKKGEVETVFCRSKCANKIPKLRKLIEQYKLLNGEDCRHPCIINIPLPRDVQFSTISFVSLMRTLFWLHDGTPFFKISPSPEFKILFFVRTIYLLGIDYSKKDIESYTRIAKYDTFMDHERDYERLSRADIKVRKILTLDRLLTTREDGQDVSPNENRRIARRFIEAISAEMKARRTGAYVDEKKKKEEKEKRDLKRQRENYADRDGRSSSTRLRDHNDRDSVQESLKKQREHYVDHHHSLPHHQALPTPSYNPSFERSNRPVQKSDTNVIDLTLDDDEPTSRKVPIPTDWSPIKKADLNKQKHIRNVSEMRPPNMPENPGPNAMPQNLPKPNGWRRPGDKHDRPLEQPTQVPMKKTLSITDRKSIYIANLDYNLTKENLIEIFGVSGPIFRATLQIDKVTMKSKGFAYIQYQNESSARHAVNHWDGKKLFSRTIKVDFKSTQIPGPDVPPPLPQAVPAMQNILPSPPKAQQDYVGPGPEVSSSQYHFQINNFLENRIFQDAYDLHQSQRTPAILCTFRPGSLAQSQGQGLQPQGVTILPAKPEDYVQANGGGPGGIPLPKSISGRSARNIY